MGSPGEQLSPTDLSRPEVTREESDNLGLELLLAFLLAEDDSCIDVGANQGRFLSEMLRRAPRGRHLAFEPVPFLAAGLRAKFPSVEVHESALSDVAGQASFVEVLDDPAYSGLRERSYPGAYATKKIKVATERLDDIVTPDYFPRLVKIDVEGNELAVFRGGVGMFTRARPVIVFESGVGAADRYGTTPEDIFDIVCDEFGLRLFDLSGNGALSRAEYVAVWNSGARWNWLARP